MALTQSQLEEFWKVADKNNDGKLTVWELINAIKSYRPDIEERAVAVSIPQ